MIYTFLFFLLACGGTPPSPVIEDVLVEATASSCNAATNVCPDYAPYWKTTCPVGSRCITFTNHCTKPVALAYNIGCNGDGSGGAPQCACTDGPVLAKAGGQIVFQIVDGNYTSCLPSWEPACLTASLAVIANLTTADCTRGTRIEFTAGNTANIYGHFDSYDIDVEKAWYSVPTYFAPDLPCANDHANHDCRPLWCNETDCPDAYQTPTAGGCPDGRSPQATCQDTFGNPAGYRVDFCPVDCATTGGTCPSCQDAVACSP